jgi:hypothetical protein
MAKIRSCFFFRSNNFYVVYMLVFTFSFQLFYMDGNIESAIEHIYVSHGNMTIYQKT